jgi:hypothetical protein
MSSQSFPSCLRPSSSSNTRSSSLNWTRSFDRIIRTRSRRALRVGGEIYPRFRRQLVARRSGQSPRVCQSPRRLSEQFPGARWHCRDQGSDQADCGWFSYASPSRFCLCQPFSWLRTLVTGTGEVAASLHVRRTIASGSRVANQKRDYA